MSVVAVFPVFGVAVTVNVNPSDFACCGVTCSSYVGSVSGFCVSEHFTQERYGDIAFESILTVADVASPASRITDIVTTLSLVVTVSEGFIVAELILKVASALLAISKTDKMENINIFFILNPLLIISF